MDDRPATECEIEITPEMIRAGANELALFDNDFTSYELGAERIFMAMILESGSNR